MSSEFGGKKKSFDEKVLDNVQNQVTPIFSTKNSAKYSSGARSIIKINNQLIGFAFSVSWKINTAQDEITTIDDYLPYEFAPSRITVEGSLGMFHIPGRGASAEFIQSNLLSFPTHRYISIEVRDVTTNDLLFYTSKAVIISRSETVATENLTKATLNWKAIGWQDEITPKIQDSALERQADAELEAFDRTHRRPGLTV